MDTRRLKRGYWAVTLALLTIQVAGNAWGGRLAIALTAVQVAHFLLRDGRVAALSVQVRIAYLALLALGQWPPLAPIYWLPLVGTAALLLFDYCAMARLLALAPWNRRQPLSRHLVWCTITSPAVAGSIVDALAASGTTLADGRPMPTRDPSRAAMRR